MKNTNSENKFMKIFLVTMSIILLYVIIGILLPCIGGPDYFNIYGNNNNSKPQVEEQMYPTGRFVSNEEMAKYETFDGPIIKLSDEEKQYKGPSKEVYGVRLVVNEEQIDKYVENFKWLVGIMESCGVEDSISNRGNKYSDSKINELSWLDGQIVENQVKILRDTGIDFFAKAITQKCYAKAKKEKAEGNLNFIDSVSNDDLIKKLEDFQHLRIELGLTNMSI